MSGVGFLGMGKIGRALAAEVTRLGHEVAFVYDPFLKEPGELPQVTSLDDRTVRKGLPGGGVRHGGCAQTGL